jgi:dihydroorotate dehydrogenase electron transfer subunit
MATEPATGLIDLLIQVVGRGSEAVAAAGPGQTFDLIGPLGNGFSLGPPGGQVFLVAGGVGVAPLIFLAEALAEAPGEREIHGLFGARTEGLLCCWLELAARCTEFTAVTEDGSAGETGLVSEALARRLEVPYSGPRVVYACGPLPMLAAVAALGRAAGVATYVSLERWMGCGVGACLGCVVPATSPSAERYLRVCKDGPVFPAEALDWEAMPQ